MKSKISRFLTTLVALIAVTTGAWADEQSESFNTTGDQLVFTGEHFTISGQKADTDGLWIGNAGGSDNTVTISSRNGENITKIEAVLSYVQGWGDTKLATTSGEVTGTYVTGQTITISSVNATTVTLSGPEGEFKLIEFNSWTIYYGDAAPAGTALTPDATRKVWTLDAMPAGNVELQVAYFPGMLTLPAKTAQGSIEVEGLTAPFTKLEVLDAWENDNTLLSAAHLPGLKEMTDAEAEKWTGASSDYVILIYGFDGTKAKTATYLGGEFTNVSSEDVTLSLLKTASADAEFYYSSEAQMPAGFDTDGTNYYVEPKTQFQVKAVPAEGYRLVKLMAGETDITDKVDADGIATITMPEGDADLTLTATFSDEYELTFDDVNFKTNQNITVKVGDAEKTLDQDGKLSVKSGQTVTLTAKQGYKFRSVEVKKKAAAVTYTELKGGEVLKVGDIIDLSNTTVQYGINDGFILLSDNSPITVMRANITGDKHNPTVTEDANGDYYVLKDKNGGYYLTSGTTTIPATATSDGISVTAGYGDDTFKSFTFTVHEP